MTAASLITRQADVDAAADAARTAGRLAFDLEFLSADRYIPILCLVQVCWPDAEPVAVDPQVVDVGPLLELIGDPAVLTLAHAAKQDLQLLWERHQVRAKNLIDTQIAAAFCGLGDQVGLARLVESMTGVSLDKGAQFTDWSQRPLSDRQLAYALDDVRYLLPIWDHLRERLEAAGRMTWVAAESEILCVDSAAPLPPDEMYRNVSGAGSLKGKSLGAARALAAWRERTAREENKPPSWLIPDAALVEVSRKGARSASELKRVRGIGPGTVRDYGDAILGALERGRRNPPPESGRQEPLSPREQVAASILSAAVQAECRRQDLAPRFVGARAEVEDLVRWWAAGADPEQEAELPLLGTWRRDIVGGEMLAWLRGERVIAFEPVEGARIDER